MDCSTVREEEDESATLWQSSSEIGTLDEPEVWLEIEQNQMMLEDYRSHELRRDEQDYVVEALNDEMTMLFLETAGQAQYELECRIEKLNTELSYFRAISKEALLREWK
jgi:hypothetical protein